LQYTLQYTCIRTDSNTYKISWCCTYIKGDQPLVTILLYSPFEGLSPQSEVVVCRQETQFDAAKQPGPLYWRMCLICTHTHTVGRQVLKRNSLIIHIQLSRTVEQSILRTSVNVVSWINATYTQAQQIFLRVHKSHGLPFCRHSDVI
jgi:hypothetical protein